MQSVRMVRPNGRLGRVSRISLLFFLVLLVVAPGALAHKVNVFAWVEGDRVFVEGYFAGNKKAQNSLVEVFNSTGVKLLEGKTNSRGEFSFKAPEKTDLRIVLTAGMGHKNDFMISARDFSETAVGSTQQTSTSSEADISQREMGTGTAEPQVDANELEAIIDKALDRKLTPVIKLLHASQKQGPTLAEIVGGIGYIFGLMGVALYFRDRGKRVSGKE